MTSSRVSTLPTNAEQRTENIRRKALLSSRAGKSKHTYLRNVSLGLLKLTAFQSSGSLYHMLSKHDDLPVVTEELYADVLHTTLHGVGADSPGEEERQDMHNYLRESLGMEDDNHHRALDTAIGKKAPNLCLRVNVIGAKGLRAKDVNGLSDPFCVVYLEGGERKESSVCPRSLNPVWNEFFSLPLSEARNNDVLHIEVWDYDLDEKLVQRLGKIQEVRGVKGLGRYMKEVAKGKGHDMLGHVVVPVRGIPTAGLHQSYRLLGRHPAKEKKDKFRGSLSVRLKFSAKDAEDRTQARSTHERLTYLLVKAERDVFKGNDYQWSGDLPRVGHAVLEQHAVLRNISELEHAVFRWKAYVNVHIEKPLEYKLLFVLLQNLKLLMVNEKLSDEDMTGIRSLMPAFCDHCTETLRNHRHLFNHQNTATFHTIEYLLRCLILIGEFAANFPNSDPKLWKEENKLREPQKSVGSAIIVGNEDWYRHIYNSTKQDLENLHNYESRTQSLILLINMLYADIKRCRDSYNQVFMRVMSINYFALTYLQYAEKLKAEIGPIVDEISRALPIVEFVEGLPHNVSSTKGLDIGTSLFELYLAVQLYAGHELYLPEDQRDTSAIHFAYKWFSKAVNRWLDIACYKAMHRISKAIELDQATQVDAFVNHSSSAVDAVSVFYQIKTFWKQLNWPDPLGSYGFVTKVLDDITKSAIFYATQMHRHLIARRYFCSAEQFSITEELCVSLNNVQFVLEQLVPLPNELGFESVFCAMEDAIGTPGTLQCRMTLQSVIDSALENVEHNIVEIINGTVIQMLPDIEKFMNRLADASCHIQAADGLIHYLDTNLTLMYPRLHANNLRRFLEALWTLVLRAMDEAAFRNADKRSDFFDKHSYILHALVDFFHGDEKGLPMSALHTDKYRALDEWLDLHRAETENLIVRYYLTRREDSEVTPDRGRLTVKVYFLEHRLHVDILNARDLKVYPGSTADHCDPYVKVQLLPESYFPQCERVQTRIQKKTLFPLFDESFVFDTDFDFARAREGLLLLTLKNHHSLVIHEMIGDVAVPLSDIRTVAAEDVRKIEQMHLDLFPPRQTRKQEVIFETLHHRTSWCRSAQEFVKKQSKRLKHSQNVRGDEGRLRFGLL